MNSENRSTILLFVLVFAVAIVALIAVLAISWQIIGTTVVDNVDRLGVVTGRRNLDYRFQVPQPEDERDLYRAGSIQYRYTTDLPDDPENLDYNFNKPVTIFSSSQFQIVDDVLIDARAQGLGSDFDSNVSVDYSIQIPSIGLLSDVYVGNGSDETLKSGFWQSSKSTIDSEKILFCYRKFLSPNDARSCWNLDRVRTGDLVYIEQEGDIREYIITSGAIFNRENVSYNVEDKDSIQIVTTAPIDTLDRRLVITAVRN